MIKLIFEIVFLVFLTLVLYIQYSRSKENAKIEEINKRDITDEEYEVLKKFFKRKVVYYIFQVIFFLILFAIILYLIIIDCNIEAISKLISGTSLDVDIILEALMLIVFISTIGMAGALNYKIFTILKSKENIQVCEGFCVQTKSIVKKRNRKTVKYATELTDAEDYSKIILNLRPEKDKFVIEKLINPNDRIFVFSLDEEIFIMCKNTLFFKNELYAQELYKQKKAKEISKNTILNI